jgi:hypothetical protein
LIVPHIIRLRGPWEHEPLPREGTVRLTRRFHRPTGLASTSRVSLVIDDIDPTAQIVLNDRALDQVGSCHPACFDITGDLQPMNMLSITVTNPTFSDDGPLGLVRLEIE